MSWVKALYFISVLTVSAVAAGYAFYSQHRDRNANYGHGYTHEERRRKICGICLKEMSSSEEITLSCGHSFCSGCLKLLIPQSQTTCCDCRKEISSNDLSMLKKKLG